MLAKIKRLYHKIGIHTVAPGTGLYWLHTRARALVRRLSPNQKNLRPMLQSLKSDRFVIAFLITGGIGDHLIAARYIRDLLAAVGDFQFDIYSSRATMTKWIFANFPQFRNHYDEYYAQEDALSLYPVAFWICSFVYVHQALINWKRVRDFNPKLEKLCNSVDAFYTKYWLLIDKHPRLDGYLAEVAVRYDFKRINFLQGMSEIPYGGHDLLLRTDIQAMSRFGLQGKKIVTIHNGFDQQEGNRIGIATLPTKSYPHFGRVVAMVHAQYPDITIVQLGSATSVSIEGVDYNLLGKTTMEESAEIIRNAVLHIDGESGLVHMAACFGTLSCVVFGPTSYDYFSYPDNINIKPSFCGNCWWMTEDWLKECPRGFAEARCLSEQPPEIVAGTIADYLARLA